MKQTFKKDPKISQWHQDIYGNAVISRNRWTLVGVIALALAALEAAALIILTPLKAVEPYVIQVDNSTGITTVLEPMGKKPVTENEAVTKFFLVRYIVARETYDPQDLNQNYDQVRLMSTLEEAGRFEDFIRGPNSPVERFNTSITRTVRVRSVSFLNKKTAQVRFTSNQRQNGTNEKKDEHWIATLSFRYANTPMEEADRLGNPLGFQIKNYRIDQEVVR